MEGANDIEILAVYPLVIAIIAINMYTNQSLGQRNIRRSTFGYESDYKARNQNHSCTGDYQTNFATSKKYNEMWQHATN